MDLGGKENNMKKYFVTAFDSLNRIIACKEFETKKECEKWFYTKYAHGGCTFEIKCNEKTVTGILPTIFEQYEFH